MIPRSREDITETIEVLCVELKHVAQPHEIAHFRELQLDAQDAETPEQLEKIAQQVESLRKFCMSRALSAEAIRLGIPRR